MKTKETIAQYSRGTEHQNPDARFLTGLFHWGNALGVNQDNVLVLGASILGGLAAPMAFLDLPWGIVKVPKLDLIVPESRGSLPHALEFLLNAPRTANSQILERAAGINPAELRYVLHASFAGDPSRAKADAYFESSNTTHLRKNHGFDREDERIFSSEIDLSPDLKRRRVESLTRPAVLLESPRLGEISRLLDGCHLSHALGVRLNLEPTGSPKRKQDLTRLVGILKGTETILSSPKFPMSIEHSRPCGLQAIFSADGDTLKTQFAELERLLEHSLLLSNTFEPCVVNGCSSYFFDVYSRIVGRIIVQRRDGVSLTEKFDSDASTFHFQQENLRYLRECDSAGVKVGASVRGLPLSLSWTLLHVRSHMQRFQPPNDDEVIRGVFAAAEQLLRRHCLLWGELSQAACREKILRRAQSIIRKIEEKQVISFTGLIRSFDKQKTSLYRPLVDLLLEAEVLGRKPDGKLMIGSRKFDEVSSDLFLASLGDENDD